MTADEREKREVRALLFKGTAVGIAGMVAGLFVVVLMGGGPTGAVFLFPWFFAFFFLVPTAYRAGREAGRAQADEEPSGESPEP